MTTAVSNAAADTLARLDHVLATTEAQPVADAEWMPGDPLWEYLVRHGPAGAAADGAGHRRPQAGGPSPLPRLRSVLGGRRTMLDVRTGSADGGRASDGPDAGGARQHEPGTGGLHQRPQGARACRRAPACPGCATQPRRRSSGTTTRREAPVSQTCPYSDLARDQCAHCRGDRLDVGAPTPRSTRHREAAASGRPSAPRRRPRPRHRRPRSPPTTPGAGGPRPARDRAHGRDAG